MRLKNIRRQREIEDLKSEEELEEEYFNQDFYVVEQSFRHILKFVRHNEVSVDHDYPIEKSFTTVYTPTMQLTIKFKDQVLIS